MKHSKIEGSSSNDNNKWAEDYRTPWKKYIYGLVGAEISTLTRFSDKCIQLSPLKHDTGLLFEAIESPSKLCVNNHEQIPIQSSKDNKRCCYVINGDFNYKSDIQKTLADLYKIFSRHVRLIIVVYNPFLGLFYDLASLLKIRKAPKPNVYFTEKNLYSFAKLSGFEIVRIRPSVFIPFYIPFLSFFINKLLPIIPLVRRLSLVWVVVMRPIKKETHKPSLSIIIPARNEGGNISHAIDSIPNIEGVKSEIIFVEGNSTDDTWQKIQDELTIPRSNFVIKAFKQPGVGKNDAVKVGFKNASGDLVTILDADLTMPPEMLPRFYDAYCDGLGDFINGSRLLYPMQNEAMKSLNRIGNIFFSKILAWSLDIPITDSLCGTKLYALYDYKRMSSWRDRFGDFDPFGDFDMLFSASELALGVVDIPIRYRARTYGETNINRLSNGWELARMTVIGFFRILLGKTQ